MPHGFPCPRSVRAGLLALLVVGAAGRASAGTFSWDGPGGAHGMLAGSIDAESAGRVLEWAALREGRALTLDIHGTDGDMVEAVRVGRALASRPGGMSTVAHRPCQGACVALWLGGSRRTFAPGASLVFLRPQCAPDAPSCVSGNADLDSMLVEREPVLAQGASGYMRNSTSPALQVRPWEDPGDWSIGPLADAGLAVALVEPAGPRPVRTALRAHAPRTAEEAEPFEAPLDPDRLVP